MVFDLVLMKAIGGESIYIHFSGANLFIGFTAFSYQ